MRKKQSKQNISPSYITIKSAYLLGESRIIFYDYNHGRHFIKLDNTEDVISFKYHGSTKVSDVCVGLNDDRFPIGTDNLEDAVKMIKLLG